jgi:hypothetical protein
VEIYPSWQSMWKASNQLKLREWPVLAYISRLENQLKKEERASRREKKREIEIENTHIHTYTSIVDRECVRLERKLLNSLFCQRSKVIDYVH